MPQPSTAFFGAVECHSHLPRFLVDATALVLMYTDYVSCIDQELVSPIIGFILKRLVMQGRGPRRGASNLAAITGGSGYVPLNNMDLSDKSRNENHYDM